MNISNLCVKKKTLSKPISHFSSFNIVQDNITHYSSIPVFQHSPAKRDELSELT